MTKEKIPIVAGGYGNGWAKLQSTELLLGGQWQSGTVESRFKKDFGSEQNLS